MVRLWASPRRSACMQHVLGWFPYARWHRQAAKLHGFDSFQAQCRLNAHAGTLRMTKTLKWRQITGWIAIFPSRNEFIWAEFFISRLSKGLLFGESPDRTCREPYYGGFLKWTPKDGWLPEMITKGWGTMVSHGVPQSIEKPPPYVDPFWAPEGLWPLRGCLLTGITRTWRLEPSPPVARPVVQLSLLKSLHGNSGKLP